ncbi:ABC transporter ATP-binding protein [Patescibacteria group bacterium]|jgi:ABC-2 type transport system ATP-binding protein|nr:ABC transporter ATP-binding protein [Patescibacteria group bacterium]
MDALSVSHVSKTYRQKKKGAVPLQALDDVSLTVKPGEIHGLLGPNGAGKSTLISLIAGIIRADQGKIEVFGVDVEKETEKAKVLEGIVPQEGVYEMAFTVREVLYYFSGMYGVPIAERNPRIDKALEDLALSDKADERARGLSGGMKRRLMIAKALIHKPKLLILDEPTAGVDVALRQKIWELVRRLRDEGTTILFTTHYLEEAEQLCDRITLINHGRIIKEGNLKEIQKEFSKNVISFELFDRNVPHLPNVTPEGSEFHYPMKELEADMQAIASHYNGNLKSVRSEAASLEQIFLTLTKD